MKIICTSVDNVLKMANDTIRVDYSLLELNKEYEATTKRHSVYYGVSGYVIPSIVVNGWKQWFPEECFITLAEWRDKQINEILYE
jgi:hypothetical protein